MSNEERHFWVFESGESVVVFDWNKSQRLVFVHVFNCKSARFRSLWDRAAKSFSSSEKMDAWDLICGNEKEASRDFWRRCAAAFGKPPRELRGENEYHNMIAKMREGQT